MTVDDCPAAAIVGMTPEENTDHCNVCEGAPQPAALNVVLVKPERKRRRSVKKLLFFNADLFTKTQLVQ